jgi:S1-C subfamily serine protease
MTRVLRLLVVMLSLSKHLAVVVLTAAVAFNATVRAETETIDLKALAKKARPAVMLLVVSDATGKEIATGTGFLVSSDGKLITNHHVMENAASAVAKAESGGLFPVEGVLADDPKNDLVLLKLKGKDLPFLTLGNSDKIEVGTRISKRARTNVCGRAIAGFTRAKSPESPVNPPMAMRRLRTADFRLCTSGELG